MATPAYAFDEAELSSLRSLVDAAAAEADRGLEKDFRTLQAKAAELQDTEVLSFESWDWVEATEALARQVTKTMADDVQRCTAAVSLLPGEDAFVEWLRKQIAFSDALRADAVDLAAATRRMQEKDLRRPAAQEHLVGPDMADFLSPEVTDFALERRHVPTPKEMELAAGVEDAAVQLAERLDRMSSRLRRGAAAFATRPGDEALVAGLLRQAGNADAARATVEMFTASVRRFRAAGRLLPDGDGAGDGHTNISLNYLILTGYLPLVGSSDDLDYD